MVRNFTHSLGFYIRLILVDNMSRELDLRTLELCRTDIERIGREVLERERPKVARELRDLCSLLRSRVITSHKFDDVIEPLDRIIETATLVILRPFQQLRQLGDVVGDAPREKGWSSSLCHWHV
jgi:hypothetical protein